MVCTFIRETDSVCGIRNLSIMAMKVKCIEPEFVFLIGYKFIKFTLGNKTLSLYFLYNINYFNWVSIIVNAFCYPFFENQSGVPEK